MLKVTRMHMKSYEGLLSVSIIVITITTTIIGINIIMLMLNISLSFTLIAISTNDYLTRNIRAHVTSHPRSCSAHRRASVLTQGYDC